MNILDFTLTPLVLHKQVGSLEIVESRIIMEHLNLSISIIAPIKSPTGSISLSCGSDKETGATTKLSLMQWRVMKAFLRVAE